MGDSRFYICEHCGNIVGMINDTGVPLMCCGQKMSKLMPNSVEASTEKHLPIVEVNDGTVKVTVGDVAHPMLDEHNISWIYLQTDKGGHRKKLSAGQEPTAVFALCDEKPLAVYSYCNLHGLWKTVI